MDFYKMANSTTTENIQQNSPSNQIVSNLTTTNNEAILTTQQLRELAGKQNQPTSRIESKEIVSNSEYTKITKPANPVVDSVNMMNKEVGSKIEGVSQNIKTTMSNVNGGQTVNTSNASTVDQSSTYNTINPETGLPMQVPTPGPNQQIMAGGELIEFYLSSIYEILAAGIKVKMSY
jgi:hypothetical protein